VREENGPKDIDANNQTSQNINKNETGQSIIEQAGLLNLAIDNIPDIIFFKNVNGVYLGCNSEFAKHVGGKKEEIVGKTDYDIYPTEEADFYRGHDQNAFKQNKPCQNEEWITYPDGRKILIETLKTPFCGSDGKVAGILGICRDITERKEAEFKIEEKYLMLTSLNRYTTKQAESHTYAELVKVIAEQLTEYAGAIFVAYNEYDPLEKKLILRNIKSDQKIIDTAVRLGGEGITKIVTPVSEDMYNEITTAVVGFRHTLNEMSQGMVPVAISKAIQKATGINYCIYLSYIVEDQLYGTSIIGLAGEEDAPAFEFLESYAHITAISLRRLKAEEKVRYIGFHDQLTDLFNRYYFESCEKELKDIPLLSVIMTDVNGLKLINDTYGHEAGDKLLQKYADLLRKSFKQSDLIFRWGGDEFIIILKNTAAAKSWQLCNRLIKHCGETLVKDIPLSISVGISSKLQGEDISEAIREAEDMMYKHKLTESKSSKNLIVKTLLKTLSKKSFETRDHIERMTALGRSFGVKLSLPPSELPRLETLTMFHDIGNINVGSHILLKETTLSDNEWEEIMKHPEVGYRITRTAEEFAYIAEEILTHHERWDGKGYPRGLEGKSIPYLARILSLIDSYDVMSNGRPYKAKMSEDEIIDELEQCSGRQFDPELVDKFIACIKEGF
jgi:diguanylate cyclase (GGDEF)-like protein/PAS domain S-box-containing protein